MRDDDEERFVVWTDGFRSVGGSVIKRGIRPFWCAPWETIGGGVRTFTYGR